MVGELLGHSSILDGAAFRPLGASSIRGVVRLLRQDGRLRSIARDKGIGRDRHRWSAASAPYGTTPTAGERHTTAGAPKSRFVM